MGKRGREKNEKKGEEGGRIRGKEEGRWRKEIRTEMEVRVCKTSSGEDVCFY